MPRKGRKTTKKKSAASTTTTTTTAAPAAPAAENKLIPYTFRMVLQNKLRVNAVYLSKKRLNNDWKRFSLPIHCHVVKREQHIYTNCLKILVYHTNN